MPNKMERFTQRARRVLSLAQEEAERLQHSYIGTEHLLLGMMREEGGVASKVLHDLGLEYARVEIVVKRLTNATPRQENAALDLSPDTKRVLEMAVDQARLMGHPYIGTEHLLLGLFRQPDCTAVDVLKHLSISPDAVRRQVRRVLEQGPQQGAQVAAKAARQSIEADILAVLRLRVQASSLPKLLSRLMESSKETAASDTSAILKELLNEVLSEQSIILNQEMRERLLASLIAPSQTEGNNRQMRVQIADKATGEVIVDTRISLSEARGRLEGFAEVFNNRASETVILDDEKWHIELSLEEAPGAEG